LACLVPLAALIAIEYNMSSPLSILEKPVIEMLHLY